LFTEDEDHGTTTEWCGCSKDEPVRCTIYIERHKDGTARVACYTAGCGAGKECTKVELSKKEKPGETEIWWGCECKTIKKDDA
jgi:hypothetical protein